MAVDSGWLEDRALILLNAFECCNVELNFYT